MLDPRAQRIAGFGLNATDAARMADFYASAFGARLLAGARHGDPRPLPSLAQGKAQRLTLELGDAMIEIWQFGAPGRPCPCPFPPDDTAFQHFALVVSDMQLALSQLQRTSDWTPISKGGPQHLPQRSGGVTAFKFRDPEGHPLEFLEFPAHTMPAHWQARSTHGIFLGIDHSAISVRDTATSVAFYNSLGFSVTAQTLNQGPQQANLDGMPDPHVEVTALSLSAPVPHLELLCYRTAARPFRAALAADATAATRIALETGEAAPRLIVDPDGHHLLLM